MAVQTVRLFTYLQPIREALLEVIGRIYVARKSNNEEAGGRNSLSAFLGSRDCHYALFLQSLPCFVQVGFAFLATHCR